MKKKYLLVFTLISWLFSIQTFSQVNVTFRVDMSGLSLNSNGVHLAGSINGWNTTSTMLTQEGTSNIYSAVVSLDSGWYEYKFLNGNAWGTDESATYPCAASNGNRILYINDSGNDVVLEPVPFGSCNPDTTGFSVNFNVDMSSETTISPNGVHIAGALNGWNTENLLLNEISTNIYSITLRLPTPSDYPVVFEYKYLNGNAWGTEETPDAACPTVTGSNRLVTLNNSGESLGDVFNGCNYSLSTENFITNSLILFYNQMERSVKFNSNGFNKKASQIQVFDISGRSIETIDNISSINDVVINFNSHTNGLYFVKIKSNGKQLVKKVMVY